jgi:hypothetical protein
MQRRKITPLKRWVSLTSPFQTHLHQQSHLQLQLAQRQKQEKEFYKLEFDLPTQGARRTWGLESRKHERRSASEMGMEFTY